MSSQPYLRSELMLLSVKELKTFLEQKNVSSTGCTEKGDLVDVIIKYQARPQVQTPRVNEPFVNEPCNNEPQPSASSTSSQRQTNSQSNTRNPSQGMNDFFGTLQINPEIHNFVQNMFQLNESGVSGLRPPSRDELNNRQSSSHQMNYSSYRMPQQDDFTPSCVHPTQVCKTSKYNTLHE